MRVKKLNLKSFLAHAESSIDFGAVAVAVIVGANESGKSSIVDGVKWALLNRARGLEASQNKALIRRGGATTCKVEAAIRHGDKDLDVSRTPSGGTKREEIRGFLGVPDENALAAALETSGFLAMDPKTRKALVFRLAGADVSADLLRTHGIDDEEAIRLATSKGFDAAEKHCAEKKRTANRTAEEVRVAAPVDEQVQVGDKAFAVSSLTVEQVDRSLAAIRSAVEAARAKVTAAETRAAGAEERRVQESQAATSLDAARQALRDAEERAAKAASERPDAAALRRSADELLSANPAPDRTQADALRREASQAVSAHIARDAESVRFAGAASSAADAVKRALASEWALVELHAREILKKCGAAADPEASGLVALAKKNGPNLDDLRVTAAQTAESAAHARAAADAAKKKSADVAEALRVAEEAQAAAGKGWTEAATKAHELHQSAEAADRAASLDARLVDGAKAAVRAAEARLSGIRSSAPTVVEDLAALRADVATLDTRFTRGDEITRKVRTYHGAAEWHARAEAKRAELATEAERFRRMEEALRPAGVMAQLVAAPLARLRAVLEKVSSTLLTKALRLTDDWDVLYDDAPVSLASTSCQWRIGAALAIALGVVSGLRWAVLDEASVCVGETRDRLTSTLLAAREHFDQVIVVGSRTEAEMATLAAPPPALADVVRIFRVEAGTVRPLTTSAAASAAA